jgi:hypothetical protein
MTSCTTFGYHGGGWDSGVGEEVKKWAGKKGGWENSIFRNCVTEQDFRQKAHVSAAFMQYLQEKWRLEDENMLES